MGYHLHFQQPYMRYILRFFHICACIRTILLLCRSYSQKKPCCSQASRCIRLSSNISNYSYIGLHNNSINDWTTGFEVRFENLGRIRFLFLSQQPGPGCRIGAWRDIYSYGGDLLLDLNILRMSAAATATVKLSLYKPSEGSCWFGLSLIHISYLTLRQRPSGGCSASDARGRWR